MWDIWANYLLLLPKALKSYLKFNKLPNLVTLVASKARQVFVSVSHHTYYLISTKLSFNGNSVD